MKKSLLLNAGSKKNTKVKSMFGDKEEKFKSINKRRSERSGGISPNIEEFKKMISKSSGSSKKKSMFMKKK